MGQHPGWSEDTMKFLNAVWLISCCSHQARGGGGQQPGLQLLWYLRVIPLSFPESQDRCLGNFFSGLVHPFVLAVLGDSHGFWVVFVGFICCEVIQFVHLILFLLSTNACPAFLSHHWPCYLTANLWPLQMQRNQLSTYFLNGSQNFIRLTPCAKSNIPCHS